MRNYLNAMLGLALLSLSIFTSCGGEEEGQKKQFITVNGTKMAVSDVNVYWAWEDDWVVSGNLTHYYRDFAISDGVLNNSSSGAYWDSDSYTDASFILIVELGIPIDSDFTDGSFPLDEGWTSILPNANVSYVYAEILGENPDFVDTSSVSEGSVVASGSWDDGGILSVSLSNGEALETEGGNTGTLSFYLESEVTENLFNEP